MDGDGNGCVAGFGDGIGINIEAQWGARHHGEGLVLTNVEHTGCVQVTQVLLYWPLWLGMGGWWVWGAVGPWLDMSMFSGASCTWLTHPGDGRLESGGSGLQGLWLM